MDNEIIVGLLDFTHYIFELIGAHADEAALTTVRLNATETATYLDPIPLLQDRIKSAAILNAPEVSAFLDLLVEHDALPDPPETAALLSRDPSFQEAKKIEIATHLVDFFERFFRSRGTWEIDHVELVGRFDLELELWQRRRFPLHGVAMLSGFDSQASKITLSEAVSIRRLAPLAREYYRPDQPERACAYTRCEYFLEYHQDALPSEELTSELPETVHRCLTALKLLKPGDFGVLFAREERLESGRFRARFLEPRGHHQRKLDTMWEHFVLLDDDVDEVRRLADLLEKAPEELAFPLRRFARSYHRLHPQDRLLDHLVILESLAKTFGDSPKRTAKWAAATLLPLPEGTIDLPDAVADHVLGTYEIARAVTEQSRPLSEALRDSSLPDESLANVLRHSEEILRWCLRQVLAA